VFVHPNVKRVRVSLGQPWQPLGLNVRGWSGQGMQASLLLQRVQTTSMGLVPMTEGVRLVFVHPKVERVRVSLG
jgi:hypothetical protein